MPDITPCLWMNHNLEEAIDYYRSIFPDVRVEALNRMPDGTVITGIFEIAGQRFMGLNGGPEFQFNEAVSFYLQCEGQAEVDHYWEKLTANGGEESMCGWLKDRFGLSWQVVPKEFEEMMGGDDPAKVQRMIDAMLKLRKLDIAALREAYEAT
ncbi:MAG: VOC family protein [Dehalococcoidia bacterium]|nr:VOC family protein [Dehalococcoidia bacterium]